MVIIPARDHHLVIISEGQACPHILVTTPQGVNEFAFRLAFLPVWAGELANDRQSALVEWADYSTPVMLGLLTGGHPARPFSLAGGSLPAGASSSWTGLTPGPPGLGWCGT